MTTEKSESGMDQEGSTARTESRASNLLRTHNGWLVVAAVLAGTALLGSIICLGFWFAETL